MKWNNGDVVHGFNIMKVDDVEEVIRCKINVFRFSR
mgnify:CR=1 FL=1